MSINTPVGDDDFPLPSLREDLSIIDGPVGNNGEPTWSIFDPIRNKYFRIGWTAFQLLSRWSAGRGMALLDRVKSETTCDLSMNDIQEFIKFLYGNSLTRDSSSGESMDYLTQYNATKMHWVLWLIKNYLFIRIPLLRPNQFIKSTLPLVEIVFTKTFKVLILISGLIGIFLVIREWEEFTSTFLYFFNMQGAVYYGLALFVIKIFHEFGHAYMSARFGCKIPTMGVALLVMFPVLYTDTTDSWKLVSKRQRVLIGAAGMLTELTIALIATFLWSFLPDGVFKSIAFIFATTSWMMSVLVNTNIFMRFDGYYILSDLWGIDNLQSRSFAFGKWRLREILFNLKMPKPERIPDWMAWRLTLYAWGVWIYRLFLFIGIALLVYHFFFKLLGLILFAVEIIWFIAQPVYRELVVWWQMRSKIIGSSRMPVLLLLFISVLVFLFIPLNTTISIPGVLKTSVETSVYSLVPGRITSVNISEGKVVQKDEVLMTMESPFLEKEIENVEKELEVLNFRINRRMAFEEELAETNVLIEQRQELQSKVDGLRELSSRLNIRAPISGKLVNITRNLHPGRWVNEDLLLVSIIDPDIVEVVGIITAQSLGRVDIDQEAVFLPSNPELGEIVAKVVEIESTNVRNIENLYFVSNYGGEIAVRRDTSGKFVPEESSYRVRLIPSGFNGEIERVVTGNIYIYGKPLSLYRHMFESVAAVLIRESGF
jgi:putative peptide zinc metalloprotease protein